MDERNPAVLKPNRSENSLSQLNEMQFTNGVPMECQSIPLDSLCVYWTTLMALVFFILTVIPSTLQESAKLLIETLFVRGQGCVLCKQQLSDENCSDLDLRLRQQTVIADFSLYAIVEGGRDTEQLLGTANLLQRQEKTTPANKVKHLSEIDECGI